MLCYDVVLPITNYHIPFTIMHMYLLYEPFFPVFYLAVASAGPVLLPLFAPLLLDQTLQWQ